MNFIKYPFTEDELNITRKDSLIAHEKKPLSGCSVSLLLLLCRILPSHHTLVTVARIAVTYLRKSVFVRTYLMAFCHSLEYVKVNNC